MHGQRGIHAQQFNSGAWQHTLQDGLGSLRAVVDTNLATLNAGNYSAYGTPDAATYGAVAAGAYPDIYATLPSPCWLVSARMA